MANGIAPLRWRTLLILSSLLITCATALFAANQVPGIRGSIEIIRMGTKGNMLHVSDMVEVINDSRPPLTQAGDRTFEAYLPARARLDSILAAGPDKVGMLISAAPIDGEPGHFTVNFPLRPGATKFAFNYDLPYQGHATFRTRIRYPLQQLAVMIPATMKFSSQSSAFQLLPTSGSSYFVEAASAVQAGPGPAFEISGMGDLPALQVETRPKPQVSASSAAPTVDRAQSGQGSSSTASPPLLPRPRTPWWLLLVTAVFTLGIFGFLVSRRPKAAPETRSSRRASADLARTRVDILQEELSRLEVDRSRGAITPAEFESARQALDGTVKRALARASGART